MFVYHVVKGDIGMEQPAKFHVLEVNFWTQQLKLANVLQHWTGMEKNVFLVLLEKYLIQTVKAVNADIPWNGMDLLVQGFQIVKMVKFGMYILIVVNVQITCIGLAQFVKIFLFVKEEESLIPDLDVSARLESTGTVVNVHSQTV